MTTRVLCRRRVTTYHSPCVQTSSGRCTGCRCFCASGIARACMRRSPTLGGSGPTFWGGVRTGLVHDRSLRSYQTVKHLRRERTAFRFFCSAPRIHSRYYRDFRNRFDYQNNPPRARKPKNVKYIHRLDSSTAVRVGDTYMEHTTKPTTHHPVNPICCHQDKL